METLQLTRMDGRVVMIVYGDEKPRLCAGCGETIAHNESLCGKCSGQLLAAKCVWGDDHA